MDQRHLTTLTFGTAAPNGSAIIAWDIVGGGTVPSAMARRLVVVIAAG